MLFQPGQLFAYGDVEYRVRAGNRCEGDMIIEFRVLGWHRPTIAHTLILAAFKWQVEENNYGADGKIKRGRGGWYLFDRITDACLNGWQQAATKTQQEAEKAKADRNAFVQGQLGLPI